MQEIAHAWYRDDILDKLSRTRVQIQKVREQTPGMLCISFINNHTYCVVRTNLNLLKDLLKDRVKYTSLIPVAVTLNDKTFSILINGVFDVYCRIYVDIDEHFAKALGNEHETYHLKMSCEGDFSYNKSYDHFIMQESSVYCGMDFDPHFVQDEDTNVLSEQFGYLHIDYTKNEAQNWYDAQYADTKNLIIVNLRVPLDTLK